MENTAIKISKKSISGVNLVYNAPTGLCNGSASIAHLYPLIYSEMIAVFAVNPKNLLYASHALNAYCEGNIVYLSASTATSNASCEIIFVYR